MALSTQNGRSTDNRIRYNADSQAKKKALIIAISDYDNLAKERQLPFCKNDGEEIYQILRTQGYEIPNDWKLTGRVTSDQLKKAIFDFFRRKADSKDTLLFYFSGHGIPDGHGGHYLATSDIDPEYPDDHGYAFSSIQERVKMSAAKRIIMVLDCCFSGAAGITMGTEDDIAKSARSAMERTFEEGDGKCVLASSLADQVSYKMKGEPYSLFTYCLIEGLRGGKDGQAANSEGYVTPSTLGNYLYHRTMSIDKRQRPITKTATSGDIILAYHPQFAKTLEKDPFDWLATGVNLHHQDKHEEAMKYFDKAIELQPENAEAWYYKGMTLLKSDKDEESIKYFDKAIELKPNYPDAWCHKALAYSSVGTIEEAIKYADKAIELQPNYPYGWYYKGYVALSSGRYEESIKYFDKAIELQPNNAIAWLHKGSALHGLGRYEEVIKYADKAIELQPNFADAWNSKAIALATLDKDEESIKYFDKAIELQPENADPLHNKAVVLFNLRRFEESIKYFDKAIELQSENAVAWYYKAIASGNLGKYGESIKYFDKSLELQPNNIDAWLNKGVALITLDKLEEAIKCFDNAIQLQPNNATAWHFKALTLDASGMKKDAEKSLKRARELGYKD